LAVSIRLRRNLATRCLLAVWNGFRRVSPR